MIEPPLSSFREAADNARFHVETLEPRLAGEYGSLISEAGANAAKRFRTRNEEIRAIVEANLMAGYEKTPPWAVPAVDDLIDTVQVTQDLLKGTKATREAAAVAATRPIMSAMGVSFSLESPMVKDLVARSGVRAAGIAIPGLRDYVFSAISQAFEEGLSVDQTADLILAKTDELAGFQATMLAQTDLIGTANGGSLLAAKAVYPEVGTLLKQWVNATNSRTENDGKIRPTHLQANGQQAQLDDVFTVGGVPMLYPGDPSGPDAEVINCRCTLVYLEPGEVLAAGWDEGLHPRHSAGVREGGRFRSSQPADVPAGGVDDTRLQAWIRADVEGLRSIVERDGTSPEESDRIIDGYAEQMVARYHEEYDAGAATIAKRLDGMTAIVTARPPDDSMALSDPDRHPGGSFEVGLPDDPAASFTVFTDTDGSLSEWQDGVGDVLDPTDTDFFPADDTTGKVGRYVATLRSVRGDVVVGEKRLYRGMSSAERRAWDAGDPIPVGKFFTSEPTANMAQDIPGEFPELHEFQVALNDVVETDPGVFQLIRPASLKDGKISAGDVTAAGWDESLHPRHTAGVREGGRFRSAAERAREAKAIRDSVELSQEDGDDRGYRPARTPGWESEGMRDLEVLWNDQPADAFSPTDRTADVALSDIADMQGFRGLPEMITEEELQRRVRDDGWSIMYRGVSDPKFAEQFRSGDYYAGLGVNGNGIYITPVYAVAEEYANSRAAERGGTGAVVRMALRPDARKTTFLSTSLAMRDALDAKVDSYRASLPTTLTDNERMKNVQQAIGEGRVPGYRIRQNPGRFAAGEGYDLIDEGDVVTLLNRTAVAVVPEDYVP